MLKTYIHRNIQFVDLDSIGNNAPQSSTTDQLVMASLIETEPDDLQFAGEQACFYFGVKAIDLSKLDIGAEFTCVYAPSGQQG